MSKNQFGLSRNIPSAVQLEVRQRSKFGCIFCRCAIYQYEHIIPEFKNAESHDENYICLLCGTCHDKVTKGRIAKTTVQHRYNEIQNSDNIKRPFDDFDLSATELSLEIGGAVFHKTKTFLRINNEDILSVNPPIDNAAFPSISGIFYDSAGQETLRIIDNVWESSHNMWDIEIVGQKLTIKTEKDRKALVLFILPPNRIKLEYLDMYKDNCRVICKDGKLIVSQIHEEIETSIHLKNFECTGANVGIDVDSYKNKRPDPTGLSMIGGQGISLDGTGIRIGVKAGQMHIDKLEIWQT